MSRDKPKHRNTGIAYETSFDYYKCYYYYVVNLGSVNMGAYSRHALCGSNRTIGFVE